MECANVKCMHKELKEKWLAKEIEKDVCSRNKHWYVEQIDNLAAKYKSVEQNYQIKRP